MITQMSSAPGACRDQKSLACQPALCLLVEISAAFTVVPKDHFLTQLVGPLAVSFSAPIPC